MANGVSPYFSVSRAYSFTQKPTPWWSDVVKRAFDIVLSLLGLAFLAPAFLIIAILIKRDSPGPVFYKGPRLGRHNKPFLIYKFRTMYERPECYQGPRVTAEDDPRVTRLGRWLRDTKINELPQLINVLLGEMSLVGPRPEDPHLAETWPASVRSEILSVRPGITSPASVLYRNEETLLKGDRLLDIYLGAILPSKLRLDQLYVRHRSFLLDLDILLWTLLLLLPRTRGYNPPEERLFWGPFSKLTRRYISWFSADLLVTFLSIGIAGAVWRTFGPLNVGYSKAALIALGFASLFSFTGILLGINRIAWSSADATDVLDLMPPAIVATLAVLALNWIFPPHPVLPHGLVFSAALLASSGFVVVRYRSRLLSGLASRWLILRGKALMARERVLIVGGGEAGQFMAWWLQNGKSAGLFHIVGCVDDDLYKQGTRIQGVHVLGRREDIPSLVAKHDVGIIVFAIHNIEDEERNRLLEICRATGVQMVVVPDILGELRAVANGNGHLHKTSPSADETPRFVSSQQVDNWLAELETMARVNDWDAVRQRLLTLRLQIGKPKAEER